MQNLNLASCHPSPSIINRQTRNCYFPPVFGVVLSASGSYIHKFASSASSSTAAAQRSREYRTPSAPKLRADVTSRSSLRCARWARAHTHGGGVESAGAGRPSARPHEGPQPRRPPQPAGGARPGRLALRAVSQQGHGASLLNTCSRIVVEAEVTVGRGVGGKREAAGHLSTSRRLPGEI